MRRKGRSNRSVSFSNRDIQTDRRRIEGLEAAASSVMAGRVLRFVRNFAGYVMGDPWEGDQQREQNPSGNAEGAQYRDPARPPPTGGFARRVAVPRDSHGAAGRGTGYAETPVLMEAQGDTGGVQVNGSRRQDTLVLEPAKASHRVFLLYAALSSPAVLVLMRTLLQVIRAHSA